MLVDEEPHGEEDERRDKDHGSDAGVGHGHHHDQHILRAILAVRKPSGVEEISGAETFRLSVPCCDARQEDHLHDVLEHGHNPRYLHAHTGQSLHEKIAAEEPRHLGQRIGQHFEGQLRLVHHSAQGFQHGPRNRRHEKYVQNLKGEVARHLAVLGRAHAGHALPVRHAEDDGGQEGHETHEAHGLNHVDHRDEQRGSVTHLLD
mmetsp:Transcript_3816/g.4418  ORF Transcript_3816/g.4418 Transcript_3816/m.4418 type:complete len:204 (+) Transcript_3816:1109-1720(+)